MRLEFSIEILGLIFLTNMSILLAFGTSIPLDASTASSSSSGVSASNFKGGGGGVVVDPYPSMEDLASKEKFFVKNLNMTRGGQPAASPPSSSDTNDFANDTHHHHVLIINEEDESDEDEDEEEEEDDEGMLLEEEDEEGGFPGSGGHNSTNNVLDDKGPISRDQGPDEKILVVMGPQESQKNDTSLNPNTTDPHPQPLPVVKSYKPFDEEIDEKLFLILQNAVRETYFSFRDVLGTRIQNKMKSLDEDLRQKIHQLDVDMNVKMVALDTTTHSRIQTLTDQVIDQRKEDIQTFSDNLHQTQKTHQMHMDAQKVEFEQLQATMDLLNKAQSSLSTKITQLQKVVNNLESKVNEVGEKASEDLNTVREDQKWITGTLEEIKLNLKTSEAEFHQMHEVVQNLQKSASEDNGKLRRTLIRDHKQEPLQTCIRHLRNKNVGAAIKHWRNIENIAEDLKETLPADISKIIDESYGKNGANIPTLTDFVHKAVAPSGDRRLKEAAYGTLMQEIDSSKQLTDAKRTIDIFNLAQVMKADLGQYYTSLSPTTQEIVGKLPDIIKLITFDKVRLFLPGRGYLRVSADRKVSLVPQDGRFYDKDEILWQFEYDKDKSDGTFYIKSDKLQKYLLTVQEGFNSYGFSKQGLFVTGNKKENGTRFQLTIVNQGEYVLFKSVFYNGYLTWKSNVQTVYGDDDSYFLLLVDRKNGPSPYWNIQGGDDDDDGGNNDP